MIRTIACILVLVGLSATALAANAPAGPAMSAPAVIQRDCTGCHDLTTAAGRGRTPQDWSDVVDRMVDHGLSESDAELAAVKTYLAKALPPGAEGAPKELQAQ